MKYALIAALAAASVAFAEPIDPNAIDSCLKGCAEKAAVDAGCSNIFDLNCVCQSKKNEFTQAATPCIISGCPDKVTQALSLVQTMCTEGFKKDEPAPTSEAPAPTSEKPAPTSEAPAPTSEAPAPSSEAPAPSSEAPAPSSEAPAPSSEAPAPSSEAPSEAPSSETPAPTGGAGGGQIDGLSACASKCLTEGAQKQGCKGEDDNACLCTDAYRAAVTPCVAACGAADVQAALALSAKRCSGGGASSSGGAAAPSASSSAPKPSGGAGGEEECDPRGGSGACAKKYTQPATLTKAEPSAAASSSAAAAGASADAANQGSGAGSLKASILLAVAGTLAAALF